jgi:hypothetical protein
MSKVYSFRLNDENPREAQAKEVIEAWVDMGYSIRFVIVEALLDYSPKNIDTKEYNFLLTQLQDLVESLSNNEGRTETKSSLTDAFLSGIGQSYKKGISM